MPTSLIITARFGHDSLRRATTPAGRGWLTTASRIIGKYVHSRQLYAADYECRPSHGASGAIEEPKHAMANGLMTLSEKYAPLPANQRASRRIAAHGTT